MMIILLYYFKKSYFLIGNAVAFTMITADEMGQNKCIIVPKIGQKVTDLNIWI
jgi:hypothetical protein